MKKNSKDVCPLCGGAKKGGKTTFTADLHFGVVVIRNVPASVCEQCGADWLSDKASSRIDKIVKEAREKRYEFEVFSFEKLAG